MAAADEHPASAQVTWSETTAALRKLYDHRRAVRCGAAYWPCFGACWALVNVALGRPLGRSLLWSAAFAVFAFAAGSFGVAYEFGVCRARLARAIRRIAPGGAELTLDERGLLARSATADAQVRCLLRDLLDPMLPPHFHEESLDPTSGRVIATRLAPLPASPVTRRRSAPRSVWLAPVPTGAANACAALYATGDTTGQNERQRPRWEVLIRAEYEDFVLLYCADRDGRVFGDTVHRSAQEAIEFVEATLTIPPSNWCTPCAWGRLPRRIRALVDC